MIKLLYLIPLLMCVAWFWYLQQRGFSIKQGIKGFGYIIGFNLAIACSLWLIIWLTQR